MEKGRFAQKAGAMSKEHVKAEQDEADAWNVESSKKKGAVLWEEYKGEQAAFVAWLNNLTKRTKLQQEFADATTDPDRAAKFGNVKAGLRKVPTVPGYRSP